MLEFVAEFWSFLRARRKIWLTPVIVLVCAIGGLLVLVEGSAIAPFLYTLF
jgi:hypothetical protein